MSFRTLQLVSLPLPGFPFFVDAPARVLRGVGEAHVIHAQDDLPWWTSADLNDVLNITGMSSILIHIYPYSP